MPLDSALAPSLFRQQDDDYDEGGPLHADERGLDPATDTARASYAVDLARRGLGIDYPPERNAPCWCGSGRKYKKCCGFG
jgi:hypothetical protein